MDSAGLLLIGVGCVGLFLVAVIAGAVVARRKERERVERIRQWAGAAGWRLEVRPQVEWGRRMPGRNRRGVSLAVSGQLDGRPVTAAEYSYTTTTSTGTNGTSSTTTYHYVILVVGMRGVWPVVAVHRRGKLSRFGRALFGDRATAVGYKPFDRDYRVTADDPARVRGVLGRDLIAAHAAGRLPQWSLGGRELLTFREGRIVQPEALPAELAPLVRVADLIEPPR
ncbi:hypothetical protein ABZS66_14095 [Dactylosporangium sp. NPDC005572]|uniref:hypothetical protein n=1 Tax=Dactylosporangium sp. NPDC005572 TaxID=3156889 RepID=UPI0033B16F7F